MYGHGVLDGFLVHLYFVRIVDDDVELSKSTIVEHERCRLLRAVVHVTMSVHVGGGLSVAVHTCRVQVHSDDIDGVSWCCRRRLQLTDNDPSVHLYSACWGGG